jgi:hypothetical protein
MVNYTRSEIQGSFFVFNKFHRNSVKKIWFIAKMNAEVNDYNRLIIPLRGAFFPLMKRSKNLIKFNVASLCFHS